MRVQLARREPRVTAAAAGALAAMVRHLQRNPRLDRIAARPAVALAVEVGKDARNDITQDKDAQKMLFGQGART